ncbi:hypothetical protein PHYSODRAFT_343004 [Phytophthora sojae]|uniref:Uncharacterized protein n=1 Tax=Phytophthora sojae (strain P6497) TaxID=1094619 RepID=G5AI96_PHYSP|nr:hypothetical protein PHYSODRAFT_331985 [Phytophthora sojae]XP_009539797.1 hypothetical protein PHYSODRAFT_343004 [Phytophthora sojae]EGZ04821.1 hypothetical protein PHYSODRAFT_343004 [Phytophthora sojae]EGZ18128.1 hypothetical protein PHYSODRAFT_331985 [Phytophthora sojae]|eukprot:XP_009527186.1 hypothetical protein PHYSODRAFT_331985 [Phytophthora sojae]
MAPAEGDAPEARTQGDDAQERASQLGDASKASESQETPAEASPSGNERRVHFAGNNDDKEGDSGEGHVDEDGDEVMEGSTVNVEAKESDERLNADSAASSHLNAVSISLKRGFSHIPQLSLHHFSAEVTSTRSRLDTLHSPQYQFT